GRVSFYNDKKAPEKVEGQLLTIRESSLNLTVTVPVTARCLTPRLLARRLLLTLVPGCSVTERLPLVAEGGRVTVTRATVLESGCHWLNVSVSSTGESVIARVTTRAADRGRLTAQVELRTNIPRGQPVLAGIEVQLTPTWRMRLSDAAARTWQRLREAFRRLMHLPGARHRP
ncbi:MAG TPA: hypothetical protein VD902_09515, partial [Symbiobacteriaceae bacterium]|nr:hypothetical protein [Symbiobacteriaceae bacterium]